MSLDPDRFINFCRPGAHEWWHFDAISDDGRDVLVIVFYAALPFDPEYGSATLRHLREPQQFPAPKPLDHCAVALSWYRDGKTVGYALNVYRTDDFRHAAEPFSLQIADSRLARRGDSYSLLVDTPTSAGDGRIKANLRFMPVPGTQPMERNLDTPETPYLWMLVAPDGRMEGRVEVSGHEPVSLDFRGRGYHDHNAGAQEISLAMSRWIRGRFHLGPWTHIYYLCEPHESEAQGYWITYHLGQPAQVRKRGVSFFEERSRWRNLFGLKHGRRLKVSDSFGGFWDHRSRCLDDGPCYRRWVSTFTTYGSVADGADVATGLSELLQTRNLHKPLFNWVPPFRVTKQSEPHRLGPTGDGKRRRD